MTVQAWIEAAQEDARRQGHESVLPVLDVLARAITVLRKAPWNRAIDEVDDEIAGEASS